ncbi:MAG: electron transport complex protein RnfA [Lachnospiraceae bacterium]|jgi:electron transport complex protein RnfA
MSLGATLCSIFLASILTNNYVLSRFLGICPFLGVSKKLDTAVSMSLAVIVVMTIASIVTWPIQHLILTPLGIDYLQTLVFILIIAALVQFIEAFMKKNMPPLYQALGIYLPLITTNCAVLGITTLNIDEGYTFLESIVSAIGSGVGYLVAMVLFAGVRERLETSNIPKSLQGLPIVLVSAAIVACSFLGFGGLVDGIFGT